MSDYLQLPTKRLLQIIEIKIQLPYHIHIVSIDSLGCYNMKQKLHLWEFPKT